MYLNTEAVLNRNCCDVSTVVKTAYIPYNAFEMAEDKRLDKEGCKRELQSRRMSACNGGLLTGLKLTRAEGGLGDCQLRQPAIRSRVPAVGRSYVNGDFT